MRFIPISINKAGGIIAYLNLPSQIAKHPNFTGETLTAIMESPLFSDDKARAREIRKLAGHRTYSTAKDWMRRYRDER